jgi:signal transduction histidine kinase
MARKAPDPVGPIVWIRHDDLGATFTAGDETPTPCAVEPHLGEALAGATPVEVTVTTAVGAPVRLAVAPVPGCPGLAVGVRAGAGLAAGVEHLVNQIAHDLRNHAFGIGLRAELGQRRAEPGGDLHAQFTAVLRQVDALKGYVDRLLLFGRTPVLRPADLDAVQLLNGAAGRFRNGLDPAGAPPAITVVAPASPVRVRWDAAVVSAAVNELLDNAARSARPAPPIEISLAELGAVVRIGVSDRGLGVPAAALANLAQPMAVRRAGGAGLGLAIARKMAEAHGGRLTVEAQAAGTTASIELPREVDAG